MTKIILGAVDIANRESCDKVISEAATLARHLGAEIHLCYVLPYGFYSYIQDYIPPEVVQDSKQRAEAELESLIAGQEMSGIQTKIHLRQGGVYQQLLLLAEETEPEMIVINAILTHVDGSQPADMGPVTSRVARYARCKVLIVR